MIVAIDGPAGAGKTSVSKRLAESLGFIRLDTGALYRAVALRAQQLSYDPSSPELGQMVIDLDVGFGPDGVTLGGQSVERQIRTPEMSVAASRFSAIPAVRAGLLALQRRLGQASDSVVDGRDIGTVVFPRAEVKVFLTAAPEVRARRREQELLAKGQSVDFEHLLAEIKARDQADSERPIAPLRPADDAYTIDSSNLSLEDVVAQIAALVQSSRAESRGDV